VLVNVTPPTIVPGTPLIPPGLSITPNPPGGHA